MKERKMYTSMEDLRGLTHLFVTVFFSSFSSFMVVPAITDVTMMAACPGRDHCSLAIYLTGSQQAIIGLGAVVMTPIIGNLSDNYGRKALLTLPMTLSTISPVILAYSRDTYFFYAYFVSRALTGMVGEGCMNSLALAYVADNISDSKLASAFGVLAGVVSSAVVFGTLAARFLSPAMTFQVAALLSMLAAVYMRIFLKESVPGVGVRQPMLKEETCFEQCDENETQIRTAQPFKKLPSVGDFICLIKSSPTFSQAAVVSFFNGLSDGGLQACLMYFLKARFHFDKNQFADLMLIVSVAGTLSQLIFMPILVSSTGEEKLLSVGLLLGSVNMFLYSISWSIWVPYAATVLSLFAVLIRPCICSIASKQVGPSEQGIIQGVLSGVSSFANIIAPLIFSPLTALFLSEGAPFSYPGFSILCLGLAMMIAFVQSLMIRVTPATASSQNTCCEA